MMTFDEVVAEIQALTPGELELWITERWVQPLEQVSGPVFREADVARVRLIAEIRYDFEVSADVLPLFLSVLDQSHDLRRRLDLIGEAIAAQPEAVREDINRTLKAILER